MTAGQLRARSLFSFFNIIICTLVYGWLPGFVCFGDACCGRPGPSLPRLAWRGCNSLGEQSCNAPTGQSGTGGGKQPRLSGPCPGAPHARGKSGGTAGRAAGQRDSGQGAGLPVAGCRDTNSREQDYRKQLCSALGSLPAVSTRELSPARPEGEGKEKASFFLSLTVLGAQREGEEGLDKDPILDCLISKAPFKPEAAQVQPELRVFPSLPARSRLGVGREGTGHSLGDANCQLQPGRGALRSHTSAGAWA